MELHNMQLSSVYRLVSYVNLRKNDAFLTWTSQVTQWASRNQTAPISTVYLQSIQRGNMKENDKVLTRRLSCKWIWSKALSYLFELTSH
jgi:hypothetical protein